MPSDPAIGAILSSAAEVGDMSGVVALAVTSIEVLYEGAFGSRAVGKPAYGHR
jgi:hypothetical protein